MRRARWRRLAGGWHTRLQLRSRHHRARHFAVEARRHGRAWGAVCRIWDGTLHPGRAAGYGRTRADALLALRVALWNGWPVAGTWWAP